MFHYKVLISILFTNYININNQNIEIEKLSIEELTKYSKMLDEKENRVIAKQNEYLSQLIG